MKDNSDQTLGRLEEIAIAQSSEAVEA